MDKKVIIIIAIVVVAGALLFGLLAAKPAGGPTKSVVVPEGTIFFYGQECPHCKVVEDFIAQNHIDEKVKYTKLEVWHNADNQQVLLKVAQMCKVSQNDIGVPFLYDGTKCYMGEVDVNNFFKQAAGIK